MLNLHYLCYFSFLHFILLHILQLDVWLAAMANLLYSLPTTLLTSCYLCYSWHHAVCFISDIISFFSESSVLFYHPYVSYILHPFAPLSNLFLITLLKPSLFLITLNVSSLFIHHSIRLQSFHFSSYVITFSPSFLSITSLHFVSSSPSWHHNSPARHRRQTSSHTGQ